jgi:hypothetical protein
MNASRIRDYNRAVILRVSLYTARRADVSNHLAQSTNDDGARHRYAHMHHPTRHYRAPHGSNDVRVRVDGVVRAPRRINRRRARVFVVNCRSGR